MKLTPTEPPRVFEVGLSVRIQIKECARIELEPDEMITFMTPSGAEYDLTRKSWGYYATPSMNGRLAQFGLRAVLIKNRINRYFVLLVECGKEDDFAEYVRLEQLSIVSWMDGDSALARLDHPLENP